MPRGLPRNVRMCLEKSRESAMLAVEVYNKPAVSFRTGGFTSLIVIAWTSLFHAVAWRSGSKPYFRKKGSRRYETVDGDYKHWDLGECLKQYYGGVTSPERENLEFMRRLRNKVEHRTLPEIDPQVFGECQACILNFEDAVTREFGEKHSVNAYSSFPLRMTRTPPAEELRLSATGKDVLQFVDRFRGSLSTDIVADQRYCFQVYLVPKVGSRPSLGTAAVEFVHYDPARPEEMAEYSKVVTLIKERRIPVVNLGRYKATQIVANMKAAGHKDFTTPKHCWAWQYYGVRPGGESSTPAECKSEYCIYDTLHGDYVYTEKWLKLLTRDWGDPDIKAKILAHHDAHRRGRQAA